MHKKKTDSSLDSGAKGLNRDIVKEKILRPNKDTEVVRPH